MLWNHNSRSVNLLVCLVVLFCVGLPSALGLENVALNKPCTASSVYGGLGRTWYPSQATDGIIVGSGWNAGRHASESSQSWLKVDLERVYMIDTINLWTEPEGKFAGYDNDYQLYGSLDDVSYQLIGEGTLVQGHDPMDELAIGQSFQYLRYNVIGGSNWANLSEIEVYGYRPLAMGVTMDIMPGNDINPVNPKSNGALPVAIYGTDLLDVTQINLDTLMLEGMGLRERGNSGNLGIYGDINGDSIDDLMLHFDMRDLDIEGLDDKFTLNGRLLDGTHLLGSDTVRIVPNGVAFAAPETLAASWGGSGAAIPEPATLGLLAVGGGAVVLRRRRRK